MKPSFFALGLLISCTFSAPASAWWYWYYGPATYGPQPMWYHSQIPYTPFHMWYSPGVPLGMSMQQFQSPRMQMWSTPGVSLGLYVEQLQSPAGYGYRVIPAGQRLEDIRIDIEGESLVIRSQGAQLLDRQGGGGFVFFQQSGGSVKILPLPADANVAAMRFSTRQGALEIFIPRMR